MVSAEPSETNEGSKVPAWPGGQVPSQIDTELVRFVWRALRRLGVPEPGLDDATQEVFMVAVRRQADFLGRSSVKTWLFGIALNIAQRARSALKRERSEALPDALVDVSGSSQEEALARREAVETLYRILDELDHEKRVVFVMAELEQMSAPVIAELTDTPQGTVYTRLRAARREFDAALRRHRARDEWRDP
jgi:RNA polymerase sigma-70 factor, ECF subfamily